MENKFTILAANILSTFTQIVFSSNDNVSGTSLGRAVRALGRICFHAFKIPNNNPTAHSTTAHAYRHSREGYSAKYQILNTKTISECPLKQPGQRTHNQN